MMKQEKNIIIITIIINSTFNNQSMQLFSPFFEKGENLWLKNLKA